MSDVEHELVKENQELRDIARRALVALRDTQDVGTGEHDDWIDGALAQIATPAPSVPE